MRKSSMALPYLKASRRRCECGRYRSLNGLLRADRKALPSMKDGTRRYV